MTTLLDLNFYYLKKKHKQFKLYLFQRLILKYTKYSLNNWHKTANKMQLTASNTR